LLVWLFHVFLLCHLPLGALLRVSLGIVSASTGWRICQWSPSRTTSDTATIAFPASLHCSISSSQLDSSHFGPFSPLLPSGGCMTCIMLFTVFSFIRLFTDSLFVTCNESSKVHTSPHIRS